MKNLIILLFSTLVLTSCFGNGDCDKPGSDPMPDTVMKGTIALVPMGDFTQKEAMQLRKDMKFHLKEITGKEWSIKVLPNEPLPEDAYYAPRNRYRADKIIHRLKVVGEKGCSYVALTHKDISTSVHGHKDYGVMGLSYRPGNAPVVSTYRVHGKNQFWKVAVHELFHGYFGLFHCKMDDPHCIMKDAKGKGNTAVQRYLCDDCRQSIGQNIK